MSDYRHREYGWKDGGFYISPEDLAPPADDPISKFKADASRRFNEAMEQAVISFDGPFAYTMRTDERDDGSTWIVVSFAPVAPSTETA